MKITIKDPLGKLTACGASSGRALEVIKGVSSDGDVDDCTMVN